MCVYSVRKAPNLESLLPSCFLRAVEGCLPPGPKDVIGKEDLISIRRRSVVQHWLRVAAPTRWPFHIDIDDTLADFTRMLKMPWLMVLRGTVVSVVLDFAAIGVRVHHGGRCCVFHSCSTMQSRCEWRACLQHRCDRHACSSLQPCSAPHSRPRLCRD